MEIGYTMEEESLSSRAKPCMGPPNLQAVSSQFALFIQPDRCFVGSEDCW